MINPASRLLSIAALVALLFGAPEMALAQNGRIRGTVRDASGDPVAGVTVRAQSPAATGRATTAADGSYTIADLSPGSYLVTASLPGLRAQVRQNVVVRANSQTSLDIVMQAVELEAVTVTAMLREQKLADIPFSIAAPTEQALRLRGADNIETIAANVAGFSVQNLGPGQSQVAMRGASSGQIARDQPGVKEQVGAYLDESPVSLSLFTPDLDLFDVSRVEVLRGPQGTLHQSTPAWREFDVRRGRWALGGRWLSGQHGQDRRERATRQNCRCSNRGLQQPHGRLDGCGATRLQGQ